MKVVVLTGGQSNQRALCNKIADVCEIAAIVVSQNIAKRKPSFPQRTRTLFYRAGNRLFSRQFTEAWFQMLAAYDRRFPEFPDVPIIRVRNVNDDAVLDALAQYLPDLTVVSGTNLVGKKVITAAQKKHGLVNLHTGISPYVKGGPNCTNWCLAKGWFHLIGNTVMWLDAGIDTGRVIATEQTPLSGSETLFDLHLKVMEHAHELYVRALRRIANGDDVPSVAQDSIDAGTLFYTADWNPLEARRGLKNFRNGYAAFFADADRLKTTSAGLKLVSLDR